MKTAREIKIKTTEFLKIHFETRNSVGDVLIVVGAI